MKKVLVLSIPVLLETEDKIAFNKFLWKYYSAKMSTTANYKVQASEKLKKNGEILYHSD